MPINKRDVVNNRKMVADRVAATFLPLERSAHETATHAALCVASILEQHAAAALPPTAGHDAIELLSEAARLSALSRNKVVKAHELLRNLPEQLNIPSATAPECPIDDEVFGLPIGQHA